MWRLCVAALSHKPKMADVWGSAGFDCRARFRAAAAGSIAAPCPSGEVETAFGLARMEHDHDADPGVEVLSVGGYKFHQLILSILQ